MCRQSTGETVRSSFLPVLLTFTVASILGSACASPGVGIYQPSLDRGLGEKPFASAKTLEPDGLWVLVNGDVGSGEKAWVATDRDQFMVLWKNVRAPGKPPQLSFDSHVVFGMVGPGGVCGVSIDGIEAYPSGVLKILEADENRECIIVLRSGVAQVLAVPRRLLRGPRAFLWDFAFEIPEASRAR